MWICVATLFIISRIGTQLKCPIDGECINELLHIRSEMLFLSKNEWTIDTWDIEPEQKVSDCRTIVKINFKLFPEVF